LAKRSTLLRVYVPEKLKLKDLSLELSNLQKERVSIPETMRRIANIPNLREVLAGDAIIKRRLR